MPSDFLGTGRIVVENGSKGGAQSVARFAWTIAVEALRAPQLRCQSLPRGAFDQRGTLLGCRGLVLVGVTAGITAASMTLMTSLLSWRMASGLMSMP